MIILNKLQLRFGHHASAAGFQHVYPNASVAGCWFHYAQVIIKRINKICLKEAYTEVMRTSRTSFSVCWVCRCCRRKNTETVYNNTHRWRRRLVQTDGWSSFRPDIPCSTKIVHLCLIWCHVVRSRDVHHGDMGSVPDLKHRRTATIYCRWTATKGRAYRHRSSWGDWNRENGQRETIKIVGTDIARPDNVVPDQTEVYNFYAAWNIRQTHQTLNDSRYHDIY